MRIKEIDRYNNLIKEHHENLKGTFDALDFIQNGNKIVGDLNIDFSSSETHIKYYCFLTSSFLDLLTTLKGFFNSNTDWENIYYSKSGYLCIYETIDTYNFYQKNISEVIKSEFPEFIDKLKDLNLLLKEFKRKYDYQRKMTEIRNRAGGHYDNDFFVYYEQIQKLDKNLAIITIEEFINLLKYIMDFVYKIADKSWNKTNEKVKKIEIGLLNKISELNNK